MKIAIITDQHFGARKEIKISMTTSKSSTKQSSSQPLKRKESTLLSIWVILSTLVKVLTSGLSIGIKRFTMIAFSLWASLCIQLSEITQDYYKDTNEINSVDLLLREYDNVVVYGSPTEVEIGGLKTFFIPWINDENREDTMAIMKRTKAKVAFGHLEMRGFYANKTYICEHGEDKANYSKFEKVFSKFIIITETFKIMSTILGTHMKSIGMM